MPYVKTKRNAQRREKPGNGLSKKPTIAEANVHLRDPRIHATIVVNSAVSSAKVEGIKVSKKFVRLLLMKMRATHS